VLRKAWQLHLQELQRASKGWRCTESVQAYRPAEHRLAMPAQQQAIAGLCMSGPQGLQGEAPWQL
jgi:hypothetical protein